MEYITKKDLSDGYYGNLNESRKLFSDANYKKTRNPYSFEISIFLSHSHQDAQIVEQIIPYLNRFGIDVYVDWLDDEMPSTTSGVTAQKIKNKIKEHSKFILLATENALISKWCNWELGFGDAQKYINHLAILPVAENNGQWSGNEYVQIYPTIIKEKSNNYPYNEIVYVKYPDNTKEKIELWLKK